MEVQIPDGARQLVPGSAVLETILTGLILIICLGFMVVDRPTDLLSLLININMKASFDNQALKFVLAALALGLSIWRSLKMYRSGVMSLGKQCALLLLAPAAVCLWLFLILSQMKFHFM